MSTTGKPASTPEPSDAFETLLDGRDEFLRHRAADDLVLELKARAGRGRLGNDLDARELAVTAGLLLMRVVDGRRTA